MLILNRSLSILLFIGSIILIGCGGGSSSTTPDTISPVFTSNDDIYMSENQVNVITVHATDVYAVAYNISGGDDQSLFFINSSSGELKFISAPDYENPSDLDHNNIYDVIIRATDTSNNYSEQIISVTVTDVEESSDIVISGDYHVESLGTSNTINRSVSLGSTPKSLYLVLSNSANTIGSTTITHNAKVSTESQSKILLPASLTDKPLIIRTPQYIQDFSSRLSTLLTKQKSTQIQAKTVEISERMADIVGQKNVFCTNMNQFNYNCSEWTNATARKVVSDISTNVGTKVLNIWVSDDSFDSGSGCSKTKCVTQSMVDELANYFLTSGFDNDIYDWVTNIYGEEWGADHNDYNDLIPKDDEITILLTDIDNDNSENGGVVGFFWSKDNFLSTAIGSSNERIMFYIDSVMFANADDSWDIDDYWPKEMISTLAHEFQHMINFYQKYILFDSDTDTWISEMLSEGTEDLIATKIHHTGPRGVDYTDGSAGDPGNTLGRYPLFNDNNTLSLTTWNNELRDYSKVNAFGAYLLRNYGGAKLFHDIMHNGFSDEQAVVDSINKTQEGAGKTFSDLLREWGVAIVLSDHTTLLNDTEKYNTGDFMISMYNNIDYELGSINFFNYLPLPTIYTTSGNVQAQGNYYYKIGDDLTGNIDISLELDDQIEATLIAK